MSTPILRKSSFAVFASERAEDGSERKRYIFDHWCDFELPAIGVYTIEGANQSGKSVLVKLLMGALPMAVTAESEGATFVENVPLQITDVATAFSAGLVAVFQDDSLVPTMTVEDQLFMRHATPGIRQWFAKVWYAIHGRLLSDSESVIRQAGIESRALEALTPNESDVFVMSDVRRRARALLRRFGEEHARNLRKYPGELSGGGKAVVRLVNAQMNRDIKVLFLDEAFAGVSADVWPSCVDRLREWAEERKVTIVVVTHNPAEVVRWQPVQRFVVSGRRVLPMSPGGHSILVSGIPARNESFPIYCGVDSGGWQRHLHGPVWLIYDEALSKSERFRSLERLLSASRRVIPRAVRVSRDMDTWELFRSLCEEGAESISNSRSSAVLVGGGLLLNAAGFAAAALYRGSLQLILVPSTLMAVADVVVGSKTAVSLPPSGRAISKKHALGTYFNPSAVVIDRDFLDSLSPYELRMGLAECLKHGLLQDQGIWSTVGDLLNDVRPSTESCLSVALKTLNLKRELLASDPWEESVGELLLFGHLHAHSLERALEMKVSHGQAVYWGMLVELRSSQAGSRTERLLASLMQETGLLANLPTRSITLPGWEEAYAADARYDYQQHDALRVPEIGCYRFPTRQSLRRERVTWATIRNSITSVTVDFSL